MLCAVYFTIDKHSYEQVHQKVEPKSFLYKFLNSGDPLYVGQSGYRMSVLLPNEKRIHHLFRGPYLVTGINAQGFA